MERYAAVFEAADPPRTSTVAFYPPVDDPRSPAPAADPDDGSGAGEGFGDRLTIATPDGVRRTVPAVRLPVVEAVPLLSRARRTAGSHPAAAFWGAAVVVAVQLVARGRVRPAVTDGDFDAWVVGPLDAADH
ncbi:hypothetical protein AB0G02_37295, partial [Actinosynnema sp. NPDC023658]